MILNVVIFLIPMLLNFRFNFIGSISIGEVILFAVAPFFVTRCVDIFKFKYAKLIIALLCIYFFFQLGSDYYRGSDRQDYLRGLSRILVTLSAFFILSGILQAKEKRIVFFILGYGFAAFFNRGITIDVEFLTFEERFKFGIGACVAYLAFLAVGMMPGRFRLLALAFPVVVGVLAFFLNARSLAGVIMLSVLLGLLIRRISAQHNVVTLRTAFYTFCVLISAFGLLKAYEFSAGRGYLGALAQEKYQFQTELSGKFSVLSGRDEVYYTIPKIIDSPLIGWGSWHHDRQYVIEKTIDRGYSSDAAEYISSSSGGLVPSHSHLFGGWMEAGLGGGVFWLFTMWLLVKAILGGMFNLMTRAKYLVLFILVGFMWDIVFSPYGGERRVWVGFMLLLLVYLNHWHARYVVCQKFHENFGVGQTQASGKIA